MSGTEINDSWKLVFVSARLLGVERAHIVIRLNTHFSDGSDFYIKCDS
jgi:hypothetical protein